MKRWKKWVLRIGLGTVAVVAAGLLGVRFYFRWTGRAELARITAELDATDPGWRLPALTAAREAKLPPDDENVYALSEQINARRSAEYQEWRSRTTDWLPNPDFNRLPRPEDAAEAKRVRDGTREAVDLARRLRRPARGGVRYQFPPTVIDVSLEHVQKLRQIAGLLQLDALTAAYDRDPDRAVSDLYATLNAARAIDDEPFLIAQLVRIALASIAADGLEWTLGWTEADAGLAEFQAALLAEADEPVLTLGLRGERAIHNQVVENMDAGLLAPKVAATGAGEPIDWVSAWFYRSLVPGDHALLLTLLTRSVEVSREPSHEWKAGFAAIPEPPRDPRYILTGLLLPAVQKVSEAAQRQKARLRSAAAAVACERFRRANGRWPNDLAEIPRSVLPAVPADPFDGRPLRFRRVADGVVVYAVGPDLVDDGGNLTREYKGKPGEDYGFRLWDPSHRRAEPLPKPKADDEP